MLQTLLVEFFDHHFDKLHMFQSLPDQQAMMITQAVSFTGFHNQVNLNFPAQGSAAVSASPAGPIVYRTASAGAGAPRAGGNGCYALAGNPAHPRVRAGCNDNRRLYSDVFAGLLDLGRQGPKEHWVGKISDAEKSAVKVAPEVLAQYIGIYKGVWARRPRTVEITFSDGALFVSAEGRERRRLVPQLATRFSGSGLGVRFRHRKGVVTRAIEGHISGDYPLERQK